MIKGMRRHGDKLKEGARISVLTGWKDGLTGQRVTIILIFFFMAILAISTTIEQQKTDNASLLLQ